MFFRALIFLKLSYIVVCECTFCSIVGALAIIIGFVVVHWGKWEVPYEGENTDLEILFWTYSVRSQHFRASPGLEFRF